MAEFEEKLNAILGDPEAMGQIISIAKALTGEGGGSGGPESPAQDEVRTEEGADSVPDREAEGGEAAPPAGPPAPQGEGQTGQTDWGAILGLLGSLSGGEGGSPLAALGNLDPRLIQTAIALFSEYSATDDRKVALLSALKPFVKEERYAKVDKAIQIAKLSRVIRVAFQLFKKEGGKEDV